MAAALSEQMKKLVAEGRLPAVGAVALDTSGRHIYNSAFGTLNSNEPNAKPFTNDTQIFFHSCTKFLTSVAILQLLEQGKINSIDDPVAKFLPGQTKVEVITKMEVKDKPETRPQATEMKIIHLLTHTAGYTYDFWDRHMFDYREAKQQPPGRYLPLGAEWEFHDVYLDFDPGTRYNYGINTDILGFIVEALTGLSLPDYITTHITSPLGMTNTGPAILHPDWLRCHLKSPEGQLTAVEAILPATEPWRFGGGHYLVSTLNDYSQLLLTMLNNGTHPHTKKSILKPSTVKDYIFQDFIPHVGCSPHGIGVIPESLAPGLSNSGELLSGQVKGWSCGLMLNLEDVPGLRRAGSGAWAGLSNIYYWIDPSAGKAGIVGTHVLPFMDGDVVDVFGRLEELVYSQ